MANMRVVESNPTLRKLLEDVSLIYFILFYFMVGLFFCSYFITFNVYFVLM